MSAAPRRSQPASPKPSARTSASHPRPKPRGSPSPGAFLIWIGNLIVPSPAGVLKTRGVPQHPPSGTPGNPRPPQSTTTRRVAMRGQSCAAGTTAEDACWSLNALLTPSPAAPGSSRHRAGRGGAGAAGAPLPEPGVMLLPRRGSRARGSPLPHPTQRHGREAGRRTGPRRASPVPISPFGAA